MSSNRYRNHNEHQDSEEPSWFGRIKSYCTSISFRNTFQSVKQSVKDFFSPLVPWLTNLVTPLTSSRNEYQLLQNNAPELKHTQIAIKSVDLNTESKEKKSFFSSSESPPMSTPTLLFFLSDTTSIRFSTSSLNSSCDIKASSSELSISSAEALTSEIKINIQENKFNEPSFLVSMMPSISGRDENNEIKSNAISTSLLSTTTMISSLSDSTTSQSSFSHNVNDPDEIINTARFPTGVDDIFLDYLDGIDDVEACLTQEFKLLGRTGEDLLPPKEIAIAAEHILWGRADEAEALVREKPSILNRIIETIDPSGRRVKGTLLQLAAMAGDVNINKKADEKDNGMVERLAAAGGLFPEQVAEQLYPVLFSDEAIKANEVRNKRVLDALEVFANEILEIKEEKDMKFVAFQSRCKPAIDKFKNALKPDPNKVITHGYLCDTARLHQAMQWFEKEENLKRFGGWWTNKSDVFWVNGIGSLQSDSSARDTHAILYGIGLIRDYEACPERELSNQLDSSRIYPNFLGEEFYLPLYWGGGTIREGVPNQSYLMEYLCQTKTVTLQNLCNVQTLQVRASI